MLDSQKQVHVDWMFLDAANVNRYCAWNFRYTDGSWYGETQGSPSWSGYVSLDVTRDADLDNQRSVISYHYNSGTGYYAWIDIDGGNGWGTWPNNPTHPEYPDYIWSTITVASNNNILMCTGDYNGSMQHLFITSDQGSTWLNFADFDSCANLSQFLRGSRNPGSHKVAFVHTQFITDSIASGQLDNDVWYMVSTDDGVTWGTHINLTAYQPDDTARAYNDPYAIFDNNDDLHVVWSGRRVVNGQYYAASKIFHWDEVSDTITIVSSPSIYYNDPGGWWITTATGGDYGAWRMPADKPVLIMDSLTNHLYCLWTGNDDYTDTSAAGYVSSEIFSAYSTDNGLTWSNYVDLTNTRAPGAGPGACYDEDYMTAHLFVVDDTIYTTYIEDKDAGAYTHGEGVETENPVRCWVFNKDLISGIKDEETLDLAYTQSTLKLYPNPFSELININFGMVRSTEGVELKIYDAAGRLVKDPLLHTTYCPLPTTIFWDGTDQTGRQLPFGVYFVRLKAGNVTVVEKAVLLR